MAVNINASLTSGIGITSDNSGAIQFQSNSTNTAIIDASGNVGVGTSSPTTKLNVYDAASSILSVQGDSTTTSIVQRSSTDLSAPTIAFRKTRGTVLSPSAVASGDGIGNFLFNAYGGTNYRTISSIVSFVDTYTSDTNISGYLTFNTNGGTTGVSERMRIDSSGNVLVTNAAGLGYGTGSGGTVTQATNKSTAVTLNKPTGQITMSNAALAANTSVAFLVNNSLFSSTDTIIVNISGGVSSLLNYNLQATSGANGSFGVVLRNITAGSLSEAVVLNFAIIKGATA